MDGEMTYNMGSDNMASINELKKRVNDKKFQIIDEMDEADLRNYIMSTCNDYYTYYMNDDMTNFNAAASILEYIRNESKGNNISNYINYCMIVAINTLLNNLMNRKMDLIIPEAVEIDTTSEVVVNLLERVKQKRKELKNLKAKEDANNEDL